MIKKYEYLFEQGVFKLFCNGAPLTCAYKPNKMVFDQKGNLLVNVSFNCTTSCVHNGATKKSDSEVLFLIGCGAKEILIQATLFNHDKHNLNLVQ